MWWAPTRTSVQCPEWMAFAPGGAPILTCALVGSSHEAFCHALHEHARHTTDVVGTTDDARALVERAESSKASWSRRWLEELCWALLHDIATGVGEEERDPCCLITLACCTGGPWSRGEAPDAGQAMWCLSPQACRHGSTAFALVEGEDVRQLGDAGDAGESGVAPLGCERVRRWSHTCQEASEVLGLYADEGVGAGLVWSPGQVA